MKNERNDIETKSDKGIENETETALYYWEKISDYLRDMSTKARKLGRSIVFSIIAASWTISYEYQTFAPSSLIKWSLALALIYLFLDLLFYVIMTSCYKYIIVSFFNHKNGRVSFANTKDPDKCDDISRLLSNIGLYWLIGMSLLLLTASLLMIIHVVNILPK